MSPRNGILIGRRTPGARPARRDDEVPVVAPGFDEARLKWVISQPAGEFS